MKYFILTILLVLTLAANLPAQLANSNMTLLRNLNTRSHGSAGDYSALWGYTAPNGRQYAILGCYSGTSFVDVTDSANIHEVGFLPTTNVNNFNNSWREMKTYSHYAYIVSEVPNSALQIVDLQYLPDSIHYVGKFTIPGHSSTHTISQSGPYLYLNGANSSFVTNGGIAVLDLSVNPEVPVLRGKWTSKYVHDSRIINDTIFACNIYSEDGGTITAINATNKNSLTTINSWVNAPNPGPHNVAITGDRKYALATDEINGNPRLLKIWNIQDLTSVTQVATWQPTGITTSIVHNVEVYGNYALIAHYEAGVRLVNITNPAAPVEVAWYDTFPSSNAFEYEGCWAVYMFPTGKIIASDINTGLYVIKTTIPVTGIGEPGNITPTDYSLKQNYPNPFNPSTTISFSLPKNDFVSLQVFNIAGQVVADVINETRPAGNYDFTFDAAKYGLSSGMYFYKLKAGEFSETRKMILVK